MSKVKLCFDAGHYTNYNRSNVYKNYCEGNMVWKLHLLVKEYLEKNYSNIEIITTRSSRDKDLALYNRGYKAKGCDGFYSFHSNACETESVDRVVIIKGLGVTSVNNYAKELGDVIKKCIGVSQATQVYEKKGNSGEWYGVLRGAKAAGVKERFIIEHGFHTNTKTAKWLYDDSNLSKLAEEEAKVIAKHYNLQSKSDEITETAVNQEGLVNATSLNIRKGPGTNYSILDKLKNNTQIFIVAKCSNSWLKIKFGNGYGYVSGDYIDNIKNISTTWENGDYNCKVRATANLNLRTGRGTNNSIITTIPKGTIFEVGYVYNNWGSTWDFKGQVGYFSCDYIERV